jgi:hypothetical protein
MDYQPKANPAVEEFIASLEKSLSAVSENRRDQEIKEFRTHIDEISESLQAEGMDSNEADRNAVSQMGDPVIIGAKLTEEWTQSVEARQRLLLKGIVGLAFATAVFGGLAMWLDLRIAIHMTHAIVTHASRGTLLFLSYCRNALLNFNLYFSVVIGYLLSRLMPRESPPQAVIPAAIYTSFLSNVLAIGALILSQWIVNHSLSNLKVVSIRSAGYLLVYAFYGFLSSAPILCLSAYAMMAARRLSFKKPGVGNWTLRIG